MLLLVSFQNNSTPKNDKNEIKKQVIYLYVCYWPGLEDCSSRRGIVSRFLSRAFGFSSLSFKRGFFFTMMRFCVYSEKLHFFFSFFLVVSRHTKGQEEVHKSAREREKNVLFSHIFRVSSREKYSSRRFYPKK